MHLTVEIPGLPPIKDGASSMWCKQTHISRLIALRAAVAAALGDAAPGPAGISVGITVYLPENTRHTGDLDNMVSGVLDGLQRAAAGTPWDSVSQWHLPGHQAISPWRWRAIEDDCAVEHIEARKVVQPGQEPRYQLELRWRSQSAGAAPA